MSTILCVCVRATGALRMTDSGKIPAGPSSPFVGHEVVGALTAFGDIESDDLDMIKRDLEPLGLAVEFVTRAVRHSPGKRGVVYAPAVFVENYEDAQALPGFVPFGEYTGGYWIPPDNLTDPICSAFEGRSVARRSVPPDQCDYQEPEYPKEGGPAVFSLVPMGQLAGAYFFSERPGEYVVVHGDPSEPNTLARARRFLEATDAEAPETA